MPPNSRDRRTLLSAIMDDTSLHKLPSLVKMTCGYWKLLWAFEPEAPRP